MKFQFFNGHHPSIAMLLIVHCGAFAFLVLFSFLPSRLFMAATFQGTCIFSSYCKFCMASSNLFFLEETTRLELEDYDSQGTSARGLKWGKGSVKIILWNQIVSVGVDGEKL